MRFCFSMYRSPMLQFVLHTDEHRMELDKTVDIIFRNEFCILEKAARIHFRILTLVSLKMKKMKETIRDILAVTAIIERIKFRVRYLDICEVLFLCV